MNIAKCVLISKLLTLFKLQFDNAVLLVSWNCFMAFDECILNGVIPYEQNKNIQHFKHVS